jgi:hypothetical protein
VEINFLLFNHKINLIQLPTCGAVEVLVVEGKSVVEKMYKGYLLVREEEVDRIFYMVHPFRNKIRKNITTRILLCRDGKLEYD